MSRCPAADPDDYGHVDRDAFETLDEELVREHRIVPYQKHRRSLAVFVVDPLDEELADEIASEYGVKLSQAVWPEFRGVN